MSAALRRTSPSPARARRAGMLGVAAAALTVAACSPGVAASADGVRVSTDDVTTAVTEINDLGFAQLDVLVESGQIPEPTSEERQAQMIDPTDVIGYLVAAPTVAEATQEAGLGVSQTQAREAWDLASEGTGIGFEPSDVTLELLRAQLALNLAQGSGPEGAAVVDEVRERVGALAVSLNPRYGTWADEDVLTDGNWSIEQLVTATGHDWLVTAERASEVDQTG